MRTPFVSSQLQPPAAADFLSFACYLPPAVLQLRTPSVDNFLTFVNKRLCSFSQSTASGSTSFTTPQHFSHHSRLTLRGKKDNALARSFLNQYFSTRSLSMSIMADITTIAALYLLYKSSGDAQSWGNFTVGMNSSLFGCSGAMPPEKLDIFNFNRVSSDVPLQMRQMLQTLQTLHLRRRRLNRVSSRHLH